MESFMLAVFVETAVRELPALWKHSQTHQSIELHLHQCLCVCVWVRGWSWGGGVLYMCEHTACRCKSLCGHVSPQNKLHFWKHFHSRLYLHFFYAWFTSMAGDGDCTSDFLTLSSSMLFIQWFH